MSLEIDLHTKLSNSTANTGISGSKIYQNVVPQSVALPAISYMRISETPVHAMGSDPTITRARFQFNCWSTSPVQAKSIAEGVVDSLRDFTGQLTGSTTGITVQRIFFEQMRSLTDMDPQTMKFSFYYPVDFIIWSTED